MLGLKILTVLIYPRIKELGVIVKVELGVKVRAILLFVGFELENVTVYGIGLGYIV